MFVITLGQYCKIVEAPNSHRDLVPMLFGKEGLLWDVDFAVYIEEDFLDSDNWMPLEDSDGLVWSHELESENDRITIYSVPPSDRVVVE